MYVLLPRRDSFILSWAVDLPQLSTLHFMNALHTCWYCKKTAFAAFFLVASPGTRLYWIPFVKLFVESAIDSALHSFAKDILLHHFTPNNLHSSCLIVFHLVGLHKSRTAELVFSSNELTNFCPLLPARTLLLTPCKWVFSCIQGIAILISLVSFNFLVLFQFCPVYSSITVRQ